MVRHAADDEWPLRDGLDALPLAVVQQSMAIHWRFLTSMSLGLALFAWALPARATWSVVAVDPVTREVGVAVATCVPEPSGSQILPQVAGLAPGIGALAAQAQFSQQTRDRALTSLRAGEAAQALIDAVVASDRSAASRQYGVVTLTRGHAAYTGSAASAWAGSVQAANVSVQGNILVGREVVTDALDAFTAAGACTDTLADRLLRALEAGASQGGDSRCPSTQGALVSVLRVAAPDEDGDAPSLDLLVKAPRGGESPLLLLRRAYDSYRESHPRPTRSCTTAPNDAGVAGASPRDAGASVRDAGEPESGGVLDAAIREVPNAALRDGGRASRAGGARDAGANAPTAAAPESGERASARRDAGPARDESASARARPRASGCSTTWHGAGAIGWQSALLLALAALGHRRHCARRRAGGRPLP